MNLNIEQQQLKDLLIKENYVTAEDLKKADEYAKFHRTNFIEYLLQQELLSTNLLGQAIAEFYNMPFVDLNAKKPSKEDILKIPEEIAIKERCILCEDGPKGAVVATDNPTNKNLAATLANILKGKKIQIVYAISDAVDDALIAYRKTLETRFTKILEKAHGVAPEIIDEIFQDAFLYRSSDIHFEPQEAEVLIRFRIDGILHEAARIQKEHYENILNRIKVLSQMRIDEHFAPQDGAIRYKKNSRAADLRVSIVPTVYGEKTVIRVLSEYVQTFGLSDLGLSEDDQKVLEEVAKKPFGMILVTGPTGAGKTTTLYALLRTLNRPEVNITTIEDPVEYKIVGVNQIQVSQQTELTFAKGLRAIVRQDPNIILVGEIRDEETAEISVNAALTGHMVLSTFHANDAATSIPRLLDMSVEPFLLASTLELIISQRLVRKICESCRYSHSVSIKEIEKSFPKAGQYFKGKTMNLYQGKGCAACNNTGYRGRSGIYELIRLTPELKDLILKNPSTQEIWDIAKDQGSHSLFEDGMEKVRSGETTIEEVLRITAPPETLHKTSKKNKK